MVVSESEDTGETSSYTTTSCKDVESSNFNTGVLTILSRAICHAAIHRYRKMVFFIVYCFCMEHFQEKWVNPKEKNENRKEKWAKSASKKEKKNRHKFEHNLPKPTPRAALFSLKKGLL